jgi:hypothetical protein
MSDTNFHSYADMDGLRVDGALDQVGPNSAAFADGLKLSHITNAVLTNGVVDADDATENAMDCNRLCAGVFVNHYKLSGGQQCALVVKGGSRGMVFDDVEIDPHPTAKQDVLWDDWSDQCQSHSTGALTHVRTKFGAPVRVVFGRWHGPLLIGGNCRVLWLRTIGLHLRNLALDVAVLVRLKKLPAGCPVTAAKGYRQVA